MQGPSAMLSILLDTKGWSSLPNLPAGLLRVHACAHIHGEGSEFPKVAAQAMGSASVQTCSHVQSLPGTSRPSLPSKLQHRPGSFFPLLKLCHLPWSMTHRVRLLLGSLRDFRGTTLIRRARALSRPWPETPTSVRSSKRLLMRTFSSRAGSGNRKIVGSTVAQPSLTPERPQ